jgi:hypothetical protein
VDVTTASGGVGLKRAQARLIPTGVRPGSRESQHSSDEGGRVLVNGAHGSTGRGGREGEEEGHSEHHEGSNKAVPFLQIHLTSKSFLAAVERWGRGGGRWETQDISLAPAAKPPACSHFPKWHAHLLELIRVAHQLTPSSISAMTLKGCPRVCEREKRRVNALTRETLEHLQRSRISPPLFPRYMLESIR